MKRLKIIILFFLVSCSSNTVNNNFNFSDEMDFEEYKIKLEEYAISNPYPNVDIASGSLLHSVGFRMPEYYTTFFGWARVAGISAQILDERNARDGRGTPIYRPKYIPKNQPLRRIE